MYKFCVLAIIKSDMFDEELKEMFKLELLKDLFMFFIFFVVQQGLQELKDLFWIIIFEYKVIDQVWEEDYFQGWGEEE